MVASLSVRVWTGASAGTESSAVTGIDHISADNATNSSGNRTSNPVIVGTRAYEKWVALHIDTAPANSVSNFQLWGNGTSMTGTTMHVTGQQATGATPTSGDSTVATDDWTQYTAGNKMNWDTGSYSATDATTQYAVFQLEVGVSAAGGNRTQDVYLYSYDES